MIIGDQSVNFANDEYLQSLQISLQKKREDAIKYLGTKWLLHPTNSQKKLQTAPNLLGKKS